MSKSFLCKVITAEPAITVIPKSGAPQLRVAADEGKIVCIGFTEIEEGDFQVDDGHNITLGGPTSPVVQMSGLNVTVTANGGGNTGIFRGLDGAAIDVNTDGAKIVVEVPSLDNSIAVGDGGNIFVAAGVAGNTVLSGSQVIATGSTVFENASRNFTSTMETYSNSATLNPAASVYNELSNIDVPAIFNASRFNINPAVGGTTVNSLFTEDGNPNPDGRIIDIQNIGTVDDVVFPNQSVLGTDGGKFFWAGDFTLPAGMGVKIRFDQNIGAGSWLIVNAA